MNYFEPRCNIDMKDDIITLTSELIKRQSVTPEDAGCQPFMKSFLSKLHFDISDFNYDNVSNFFATRGKDKPTLVFAGHTDVVPTGPVDQWRFSPFAPTLHEGYLYGRGAADMKGSLACMLLATKNFIEKHPNHQGRIGFLITSDEEGPAIDGTRYVVEQLQKQNKNFEYCVVGEPSSSKQLGDIIKIGRRGSLTGTLTIHGKQGHIAYPQLADNPIHNAIPVLLELTQKIWDEGNKDFPATSFQIANIHAGTGATNVIPAELMVNFNFRHCPDHRAALLKEEVIAIFERHNLNYSIKWNKPNLPFYTKEGKLRHAVTKAVEAVMQITPTPSTTGGTSDGRFIAPMGVEVVELGPCNATIHQVDECVSIEELSQLMLIYEKLLTEILI